MRSKFLQQVAPVVAVPITTATVGTAVNGATVATSSDNGALGHVNSALFHILAGVTSSGTTTYTPKIQESTDGGSTWVDVTLKTGQTLPTVAPTASAAASGYFFVKVDGLGANIRLVLTPTGTASATGSVAATVTLGDGSIESLPRSAVATIYQKA